MSYDDGLMQKPRAEEFLASRLRNGTLVLFLGAGASQGLGLPKWVTYINKLRVACGLSLVLATSSATDLQLAADEVKRKCKSDDEYNDLLKKYLYEGIDRLSTDVLKNNLFIALGSLLMGSKRGHVSRVITLNFDSMLEWLLLLHGYAFHVVHKFPELEGSEDVRIYHPHGFLPHPVMGLTDSKEVILGFDSVYKRLGTLGEPLYELARHILRSGVCLFIGLSQRTFADPNLASLLVTVGNEIMHERVTGIWLSKDKITMKDQFLSNNVVPIYFRSEKMIANFLLGICQKSASNLLA